MFFRLFVLGVKALSQEPVCTRDYKAQQSKPEEPCATHFVPRQAQTKNLHMVYSEPPSCANQSRPTEINSDKREMRVL